MPAIFKEMGILPWASVEAGVGAAPAADENAAHSSFSLLQPWTRGLFWIFPKANCRIPRTDCLVVLGFF